MPHLHLSLLNSKCRIAISVFHPLIPGEPVILAMIFSQNYSFMISVQLGDKVLSATEKRGIGMYKTVWNIVISCRPVIDDMQSICEFFNGIIDVVG